MARREMRWFRYLCEGTRRSGSPCDSLIMIAAVDETMADIKARDDYEWRKDDTGDHGPSGWFCDLTNHREDG